MILIFASSSALFYLQNIYRSGIIQSHFKNLDIQGLQDWQTGEIRRVISSSSWIPPSNGTHLVFNESVPGIHGRTLRRNATIQDSAPVFPATWRLPLTRVDISPESNKGIYTPLWQQRLKDRIAKGHTAGNGSFFLAELLQVRIYEDDKAKWTLKELKQWMHYIFLAGVQHIYLCDHYKYEHEKLDVPLKRYTDAGLVTYYAWSSIRHPMTAQVRCYQKIIDDFKSKHTWQIAVDMDEYPYSPIDSKEDFLIRYLKNITATIPNPVSLTEISMNNYLMMGQGDRSKDLVIERINRMTPKPANILVKPIYKPSRVRANIHHNILRGGKNIVARDEELRMLHYWGARTQNWGPDTPKVLSITQPMDRMVKEWAPQVRNSLLAFGETDAFSTDTGP